MHVPVSQLCSVMQKAPISGVYNNFFQPEVHEGARMCSVVVAIFTMFWHDKIFVKGHSADVEK